MRLDEARAVPHRPEEPAAHRACLHPTGQYIPVEPDALTRSIPARFAEQVAAHPDRVAIRSPRETMTYAELDRAANRIARAVLAIRGPGSEPVALLLRHDAPLLAAILGILKAGKIFVSLDPAHQPARLRQVLASADPVLLLAQAATLPMAVELTASAVPLLDIGAIAADRPSDAPVVPLGPALPAAIMYTSGSTGDPKGVVLSHRSILFTASKTIHAFRVCPEDRLCLLYSCSFSASLTCIFGALLSGAAVLPYDLNGDGLAHLGDWLNRERVTVYRSVASVFRHFTATLPATAAFPAIRAIRLSGDTVTPQDVKRSRQLFGPHCIFVNGLSTSETGVLCEYHIDAGTPIPGPLLPVGYPLDGKEIHLLDDDGQAVAPGEIGEIVVKSRYLASGYWRRPDLTEAAFHPIPGEPDQSIFFTRDLGRVSPGGALEHLGRKDFQVKIRGRRVDIAAIEKALQGHVAVRTAIVVAQPDPRGDTCLVAYVEPTDAVFPSLAGWRSFLKPLLPEEVIPSVFLPVTALPRTPNGKIDRRTLAGRALPAFDAARDWVAPRTPVEHELARIWATLLQLDRVSIADPFLELGGHSLLAGQLAARVIDTFRVDIPPPVLLDAPTIADMAIVITQHLAALAGDADLERLLADVERQSDPTERAVPQAELEAGSVPDAK